MRPISAALLLFAGIIAAPPAVKAADPTPPGFAERQERYRLQPNDEVEVRFRYSPEFNDKAVVQPDGFITLPVGGDVRVAGLTVDEARQAVAQAASQRLRDPEVSLLLRQFEQPYIVVAGEVKNPGKFPYRNSLTVMQGIAVAGGLSKEARDSQVLLFRKYNDNLAETKILDFGRLMKDRSLSEDIALKPGDVIVVPRSRLSQIERYIELTRLSLFVPLF